MNTQRTQSAKATRPIGHIAGNLTFAAIGISMRVRHGTNTKVHACWVGDDGCLYLQPIDSDAAKAMLRHAGHQLINRYRKQPDFGWRDIEADLQQARADFAQHAIADAVQP